jgi:hypothetical protein
MAKKPKKRVKVAQSEKQKKFQSILDYTISKNLGFTEKDLEPYWIEFKLMANSQDNLNREGLKNLLSTLNVSHRNTFIPINC